MQYLQFKRTVLDLFMKSVFPKDAFLSDGLPLPILRQKLREIDPLLSDTDFKTYILQLYRQNAVQLEEADEPRAGELVDALGHHFFYVH